MYNKNGVTQSVANSYVSFSKCLWTVAFQ